MVKSFALTVLTAVLMSVGCKSHTVIEHRQDAPVTISDADALVVLARRTGIGRETEQDFVACLGRELAANAGANSVISEQAFVDAMYPWFEASTAPREIEALNTLLARRVVLDRLEQLKVRYLLWIEGTTQTVDRTGSISCAVGPGGGGCFGFKSWDDEAHYEAAIWDLQELAVSAQVASDTRGTSYVPAVFVPIPLLARVKHAACDRMATQLASFMQIENANAAEQSQRRLKE